MDLRGAWFRESDLSGARIRGADLSGAELDGEIDGLRVNDVEVAPLVEAELDRRYPERAALRASDADSMRAGWTRLEAMWAPTRFAAHTAMTIRSFTTPPGSRRPARGCGRQACMAFP